MAERGRGRPPFEITKEVLETVESYASRGLTQQQIADALDICVATLYEKKKEYIDFSDAIRRGKAKGIAHVANALLRNVEKDNVTAQIFYLKTQADWVEKKTLEITGKNGEAIKFEDQNKIDARDQLKNLLSNILDKLPVKED